MNREAAAFTEIDLEVINRLPISAGSYALRLQITQPVVIRVGRLGTLAFPAGHYVYLGSARGSGGLRSRLSHHLRGPTRMHWHIDYLVSRVQIAGIWYSEGLARLECLWSQALFSLPLAVCAAPGFGATDCTHNCPAHLAAFLHEVSMGSSAVEWALRAVLPVGQNLEFIAVGGDPDSTSPDRSRKDFN